MSRPPILIKDLVLGNQVWKMLIRVVDMWVVKEKNGANHVEFIIQDGKGDRIHVTTWNRDYKEWIQQVQEHQTYTLYNGEPVLNDGAFKLCPNPLKLQLNGGTTMTNTDIPELPPHKYEFHPIESFLSGSYKHDMLYDVIGALQEVTKTQMGGGGRKSCVNFTMRDIAGNVIEVALWEDYCKQFMTYTGNGKTVGHSIIVLTHAWCKTNSVSGAPSLSNAWSGSKLLINMDHPQVHQFKESLGTAELSNVPAPSLSLTTDSSQQSGNKSWSSLAEVKSIRAILEGHRDCYATTIGTTVRFRASRFGWYFESCPGCKQSNKSHCVTFECSCGITNVEPITKFKIELEVEYNGHRGTFVFWDKDVIPYTKLTARELRNVMEQVGEDNLRIWPANLDCLLNLKLVFRVKYQASYDQFSVVTILNEENLYTTCDNYLCPNELTSNGDVNALSNPVVAIPIATTVSQNEENEDSAHPSQDVFHSGSPTASSSSTPAKRVATTTVLNELMGADDLTPKHSATKVKCGRKPKLIKKE